MTSENWIEKMKKNDDLSLIQVDEIVFVIIGIIIFSCFSMFSFIFVILSLIWYWLKIRRYEQLIVRKKRDIYNVQFDNASGVTKEFAEGRTARDREPMNYDLEQFEIQRKFLVDKFVVINLILLVLLGLQK